MSWRGRPHPYVLGRFATSAATVLGNHDHHAGRPDEVTSVLTDAGIDVLERGPPPTPSATAEGETLWGSTAQSHPTRLA